MAWLRRHRRSSAALRKGRWSTPALIELCFDPDPASATALRADDPEWADGFARRALRDGVTRRIVA